MANSRPVTCLYSCTPRERVTVKNQFGLYVYMVVRHSNGIQIAYMGDKGIGI